MAYASWSVTFGEQPSATKWNILGTNDASFNDGTGIANLAWNVTSLSNPYKFRARRTSALNSTGGSFAKITCDTEDYDTNNNFATGTYTAPVTGFYHFMARASVNGNTNTVIALYKNGSIYQRGSHVAGVNAVVGVNYSDLVSVTAGDTFDIYVFTDTTSAYEVGAGSQPYFSGYLVSRT